MRLNAALPRSGTPRKRRKSNRTPRRSVDPAQFSFLLTTQVAAPRGFLAADAEAAPACKPPSKQQAAPRVNGTSDREQLLIRVSALSAATGMSPRYWQRRITRCEVPGARALCLGRRKLYFVDWEIFETWWQQQLRPIPSCPRTSRSAAASGGTGCGTRGKISRDPSKQRTLRLLKSALSKLGKT